jgi:hypothetical protein
MLDLIYQPRPLVNQSPNLRVPHIDVSRLEPECPLNGRIEPTGRSEAKVRQGPTRRSAYESAARLGHVLLDATPIFGVEPCEALLASPFRPRLGVRSGWSPFPKDSSYGQTTR